MDLSATTREPVALAHRLDALLSPRSIALVGASARPDSNGLALVQMSRIDGYAGKIFPVNPRYREIEGLACYPTLADLPERAEHVVLSLPATELEAGLAQAIAHGAKAATIFGSCQIGDDATPPLAERLRRGAVAADLALCGGNSMGFYNRSIGLRVASFPSPPGLRAGGIAFIAQSGSAFSALAHNDRRLGFSLCMSSGMELTTTAADYVEWALTRPETRVIGLFLEQVREPRRFIAALEAASMRDVPVVILKVGRTARSAAMAFSHTGAMAGNDIAFGAMCRRYDAIAVDDLDELAMTLQFFDQRHRPGPGRLASIHDSGGEREMVVDIADRIGVEFADITAATRSAISPHLDTGLAADNPLDAWGTARDFVDRYAAAFGALVADPGVAAGVFFTDVREGYWYSAGLVEATRRVAASAAKPVMIATNYSKTFNHGLAAELAAEGIPILEGTRETLLAIKRGFQWRDRRRAPRGKISPPSDAPVDRWRARLRTAASLSELEGLAMLHDFGVQAVRATLVATAEEAVAAAEAIGFPVVLKTAAGVLHKSDARGVHLGLKSASAVSAAYADLERRLGKEALVAAMAPPGVEVGLGALTDKAFGPVVVVSAGGTLIELIDDKVAALAPFDAETAHDMLAELKLATLLRGVRGMPPCDIGGLARAISRFSGLVAALADVIAEVDVNPIIVGPDGAIAVDALVISNKEQV
jgi:acyl-CoA synthetase (NDP forming)